MSDPIAVKKLGQCHPQTGPQVHEAMNIAQFSVSKSLYLWNDAR